MDTEENKRNRAYAEAEKISQQMRDDKFTGREIREYYKGEIKKIYSRQKIK